MENRYPDDNPKTIIGLTKPSLLAIPPVALLYLGRAMTDGKNKYGLMNWRHKKVSSSIYYDAAMRHLLSWWDGERFARDSGVHHLAHTMACCAIILDADSVDMLNDDRPAMGRFADTVEAYTSQHNIASKNPGAVGASFSPFPHPGANGPVGPLQE